MIPRPNPAERSLRLIKSFLLGKILLETGITHRKNDSSGFLTNSTRNEKLSFIGFTAVDCNMSQFDDREFSIHPSVALTQNMAFRLSLDRWRLQ
jgi:hypothetical protein